jgi:DNA-binding NarL/FixJ family response regulator
MKRHRVFIVGNSLFADTIIQMLQTTDLVEIVGHASGLEATVTRVEIDHPDAVIVAGTAETDTNAIFGSLVASFPKLPIIRTLLSTRKVQVTTSRCIRADMPELLEAIATLPKQMDLDCDANL